MTTGIVLAGGASRRFGCRKAAVELDGRPLIETVCQKVRTVCADLVVVSSEPFNGLDSDIRTVSDIRPGCGPLGGIHTGLHYTTSSHALVVACDMPFLSEPLLQYMVEQSSRGYDVVVPRIGEFIEPLHAVYARELLGRAEKLIDAGERRVFALFDGAAVHEVDSATVRRFDPEQMSFFNLNTQTDLARARRFIQAAEHER